MATVRAVYELIFRCVAACWDGGSSHLAELRAVWDTLKLRVERRSDVAKDPLRAGAVGIVAA